MPGSWACRVGLTALPGRCVVRPCQGLDGVVSPGHVGTNALLGNPCRQPDGFITGSVRLQAGYAYVSKDQMSSLVVQPFRYAAQAVPVQQLQPSYAAGAAALGPPLAHPQHRPWRTTLCCRAGLSKALVVTAWRWASVVAPEEVDRLTPVVESLSQRCVPWKPALVARVGQRWLAVCRCMWGRAWPSRGGVCFFCSCAIVQIGPL